MARILIADDAPVIRAMVRETLHDAGHEIVAETASNAATVTAFAETRPDLVVLDLAMPDGDDASALRAIKTQDPAARVVMCAVLDQPQPVRDGLVLGVRTYLVKPYTPQQLLGKVAQALQEACPGHPTV